MRRISRSTARVEAARRVAQRVDERDEPLPQLRVAGHRARPQQRLALPRRRTSGRSTRRTRRTTAPAGRCGPPGAGRRRPRAPAPARPRRAAVRSRVATCERELLRRAPGRRPATRVVHEQHVGVRGVAHLAAAPAGPWRRRAAASGSRRGRARRALPDSATRSAPTSTTSAATLRLCDARVPGDHAQHVGGGGAGELAPAQAAQGRHRRHRLVGAREDRVGLGGQPLVRPRLEVGVVGEPA